MGFSILYFSVSTEQKTSAINQANQQTNMKQNWESKIDEQVNVTITVTPVDFSPQSKQWKFNIVMDTHSIELDHDLTKSTVLVDDNGKEYKPMAWEGSEAGGHHREGVLVFNAIQPMPKSVEIKIKDIGSIPERSFKWDLK